LNLVDLKLKFGGQRFAILTRLFECFFLLVYLLLNIFALGFVGLDILEQFQALRLDLRIVGLGSIELGEHCGVLFVCLCAVERSPQLGYRLVSALEFQFQPVELDPGQLDLLVLGFERVLKASDKVFLNNYVSSAPR
jgi:hypothetical protein